MGSCTTRHYLLSICTLQLFTIIERQIFDFLGYMWAPILANFFHIIFVIFGFFGAYQFSAKYLITYTIWTLVWMGWNIFLICFYLNVGILDRDSDILNLGTGSISWFEVNGYGCKPTYPMNITSEDPFRLVRPEIVEGCLLDYPTIEVVHSAIQLFLAVLGLIGSICIARIFFDDDDRFDFMGGDAKSVQHTVVHPMYVSYTSIPTSTANTTMKSTKLLTNPYLDVATTTSTTTSNTCATTCNLNHNNNINNSNSTKIANNCYSMSLNHGKMTNQKSCLFNNHQTKCDSIVYRNHSILNERNSCHCVNKLTLPKRNSFVDSARHDLFYSNSSRQSSIRFGDIRSPSIDFNFNSPKLPIVRTSTDYRNSFDESIPRLQNQNFNNVNTHPNCQCLQQNCRNGAISSDKHLYNVLVNNRKYQIPRRQPYGKRDLNTACNYGNEIRDLPPEYLIHGYSMKRTKSHDRLVNNNNNNNNQRRISVRGRTRPKSYCSNVNDSIPL